MLALRGAVAPLPSVTELVQRVQSSSLPERKISQSEALGKLLSANGAGNQQAGALRRGLDGLLQASISSPKWVEDPAYEYFDVIFPDPG